MLYALIDARGLPDAGRLPELPSKTCVVGLSLDPEDAELWFRIAVVHRFSGNPAEAEKCWRLILTPSRPEKFASNGL